MQFPFITRSHHQEVVGPLKDRMAALETELHRLLDLIFQQQFGVQLYDTIAKAASAPEPAAETAPEIVVEDSQESEKAANVRKLRAIARTRPSQLGPALETMMTRDVMRRARAAHPEHAVHPAREHFEKARKDALV